MRNQRRKKKKICIGVCLLMLLTLASCSKENANKEGNNDNQDNSSNGNSEVAVEEKFHEDELVKIEVDGGELAGILTNPVKTTNKETPVVLFVPGSGPVPKNGVANEFSQLSIELAKRGIASLRYDKRGSFDSNGILIEEDKIRVKTYVDDIKKLINSLKKDERFSKVFVLGHSQGALFSAIAIKDTSIDGFLSIAGGGRTIDYIINEQLKSNPNNPTEIINEANKIVNELKKGNKVKKINEALKPLFRETLQDYLIDWMKYDPVEVYSSISDIPVVIIQGKNDIQISEKDAKLLAGALEDNKAILIDKMSHIMKDAATKEDRNEHIKIYQDVKAPLNETLIDSIVAFINQNKNAK